MRGQKYRIGDVVEIDWPGKSEHGAQGTIICVAPYDGPLAYDTWMYRAKWSGLYLADVRQSKLRLVRAADYI